MNISVIIPYFNNRDTIRTAVDSVLDQTRLPAEIVIVDDASAVPYTGIGEKEQGPVPIRVIRAQQNTGPAGARNLGVQHAAGDWMAFLDADDAWWPDALALHEKALLLNPDVRMVCGGVARLGRDPLLLDERQPEGCRLTVTDFVCDNPVATSTVLLQRSVFEAAGGFDEQFRGPEDYDLWMRVAAQGPIWKMAAPLVFYRERPGSLSMDDRSFLPEVQRVLEKAFGPGGVLTAYRSSRQTALGIQAYRASWMAHQRKDHAAALSLLLQAFTLGGRFRSFWRRVPPLAFMTRAVRYAFRLL